MPLTVPGRPGPRTRFWLITAAASASAAGAGYVLYSWWTSAEQEVPTPRRLGRPSFGGQLTSDAAAAQLEDEADSNLQSHFDSIQLIAERTTLPQMMAELARGLARQADVTSLVQELKSLGQGRQASEAAKLEIWSRLKLAAFTRAACATWLVPLLDLLLRVQLNILGRHLFLESHLLDRGPAQAWQDHSPGAQRVTKRAQELFLEVAHYLPEKGLQAVVLRLQQAVQDALGDVGLDQPLNAAQVLDCLSAVHAEFEGWVAEQGWASLILPSSTEAAEYFQGFQARPDNGALVPHASTEADEDIARRMMSELHVILASAKFAAAAQGAVQELARSLATSLTSMLGEQPLPVAKVLPKVVAATDSYLAPESPQRAAALTATAALPAVTKLCATVYSCGPPL